MNSVGSDCGCFAPPPPQPQSLPTEFKRPPRQEFLGSSSYTHDFPGWGVPHCVHEKHSQLPHRSCEVALNSNTCYKDSYPKHAGCHARRAVANQSTILLGANTAEDANTTYARTMQNFSGCRLNVRSQSQTKEYRTTHSVPAQFHTTARQAYQPPPKAVKDPRLLRVALHTQQLNNR